LALAIACTACVLIGKTKLASWVRALSSNLPSISSAAPAPTFILNVASLPARAASCLGRRAVITPLSGLHVITRPTGAFTDPPSAITARMGCCGSRRSSASQVEEAARLSAGAKAVAAGALDAEGADAIGPAGSGAGLEAQAEAISAAARSAIRLDMMVSL